MIFLCGNDTVLPFGLKICKFQCLSKIMMKTLRFDLLHDLLQLNALRISDELNIRTYEASSIPLAEPLMMVGTT